MELCKLTERQVDLLVGMVRAEEKLANEARLALKADGDAEGAAERAAELAELKELRQALAAAETTP